jgi:hypothetical protein
MNCISEAEVAMNTKSEDAATDALDDPGRLIRKGSAVGDDHGSRQRLEAIAKDCLLI